MGDANSIEGVIDWFAENEFSDDLDDEKMFVFGHEDLGDGTDKNHCSIGFTSRSLLKNIEMNKGSYTLI